MGVDPDEGLVTDVMLGTMIAFGADIIFFVGIAWAVGLVSAAALTGVTAVIVAIYGSWIGWRWREIRRREPTERDALEELKRRYARGEISGEEFERKLEDLIDASPQRASFRPPTLLLRFCRPINRRLASS